MMIENYRNIPYSDETPHEEFYRYSNVKDLAFQCEMCKQDIVTCRTIGILSSEHGRFYLADMDDSGIQSDFKIQVSVVYLKSALPSIIIPYPVQVFGLLQWKNRPVIIIKLLLISSVPIALRMRDIMSSIAAQHVAVNSKETSQDEVISP